MPARVREKEGLSYSTYTSFSSSALDESAAFRVSAIFAPQNRERVERAIREELRARGARRLHRRGSRGRQEARCSRRAACARSQDRALASRLGNYLFVKRTFAWDIEFEAKIAALTPAQVNAALRKHIDPARLSVVVAGDLKKNEASAIRFFSRSRISSSSCSCRGGVGGAAAWLVLRRSWLITFTARKIAPGDDHEVDAGLQELAVQDLRVADLDGEALEVDAADQRADHRHDDVLDQRGDDLAERARR